MFCIRALELDGKKDRTSRFVACEEYHLENTGNFKLGDRKTGLQKKDLEAEIMEKLDNSLNPEYRLF